MPFVRNKWFDCFPKLICTRVFAEVFKMRYFSFTFDFSTEISLFSTFLPVFISFRAVEFVSKSLSFHYSFLKLLSHVKVSLNWTMKSLILIGRKTFIFTSYWKTVWSDIYVWHMQYLWRILNAKQINWNSCYWNIW